MESLLGFGWVRWNWLVGGVGRGGLVAVDLFAAGLDLGLRWLLFGNGCHFAIHEVSCQLWLHIPQLDAVFVHVLYQLGLQLFKLLVFTRQLFLLCLEHRYHI